MKIPVYNPQVPYVRAQAQNVAVAQPLKQASGKKLWNDLETAANVWQDVHSAYLDVKAWRAEEKKKQQAQQQQNQRTAPPAEAAQTQAGIELKQTAFSAPERADLLRFGREKAFGGGEEKDDGQTPLSRLDAYFMQQASNVAAGEKEDLLLQDFAVLRREVQEVQTRAEREQAREQFEQGQRHMLQTAALIHSPKGLESYLNANLDAAQTEALRNGASAQAWQERRETLTALAVRHNMQAALSSGQPERAEKVYVHFQAKLNDEERQTLQSQLRMGKAEALADGYYARAARECVQEDKRVDEAELLRLSREICRGEEPLARETSRVLSARLEADCRQNCLAQARQYERLLSQAEAQSKAGLWAMDGAGTAAQWERTARAWRKLRSAPAQAADYEAFNRLYESVLCGENSEKDIDAAFDRGNVSAEDFLRLKSRALRVQGGEKDIEGLLLSQALDAYCQRGGLTPQATNAAKYFIYTAGPDTRARLEAASKVRRMFELKGGEK